MMENKKKKIFCEAAVLLIIIATCSTVDASFVKMSGTNVSNEIEKINDDDKTGAAKFTTSNNFNDSLNSMYETIEESGLLYGNHKTALMKHIGNLLNTSVSDIKEITDREINEMILCSDNDLIKNEIEDNYKKLIKEMEARDVTDEMSFLEAMQLISSNSVSKGKLGKTEKCPVAAIISYGFGKAYCKPCSPYQGMTEVCICAPIAFGCWWEYSEDTSGTTAFCLMDGEYMEFKGAQSGSSFILLGFFLRLGAGPLTYGIVVFFGLAFGLRVNEFSTTLPSSEELEKRCEYGKGEDLENTYRPRLNNYDKTEENADYLKNHKHIEKSLTLSEDSSYIPHEPIQINGSNDFKKPLEESGVTGGSGTIADPYVIENWEINAESATGILIENTDAHFTIKNCYIYGGGENDNDGILFKQVINGNIMNCNVSYNDDGIFLRDSTKIEVLNCSLCRNEGNIYLDNARNNKIIGCISKGSTYGIWNVYNSSNNRIINCVFQNNLLGMTLLFSSSNNYITDCDISRNSFGIFSIFSWDNKINFNNICNNGNGQLFIGMLTLSSIENATNNWWGSTDGPGGKGPGCGDAISWIRGNIAFEPWLTEPI